MDSNNRGVILYRERSRQINDFRAMRYCRGITPTDLDGAFEFDGEMFIFFELKYGEKGLDTGQRIFLERIVNVIISANKKAIAIHGKHYVSNTDDDVMVDSCEVVKYYTGRVEDDKKIWLPGNGILVKQLTDAFILRFGKKEWLQL